MITRLFAPVALWLLGLVMALAGGWGVMWLLVYALGVLLVGSLVWAQVNVSGLELRRRHRAGHVQVGEKLAETVVLEPRSPALAWWPRLWLELRDQSTLPGHALDRVVSLGPLGRRVWEHQTTCTQRGRFTIGPAWVESGDPFGLFRARRRVGSESSILVYPRAEDLPRFGRVPGELPGGSLQGSRVQFTTPNVAGIRDYAPGDSFNRIHWPTTARTGRLMVREFELDPSADIWLALDLHRDVQVGEGLESTEEYGVTAAASLAKYFLGQGRSVGLVSQGATLPADRGPRQLERVLEILALVRASSHLSLDALLPAETGRFMRSSTLVVVTPSTSEDWVTFCQMMGGRGIHTVAVLVEAGTFGRAPAPILLVSSLAAARIPTYMVKRGESMAHALAAPRFSVTGHDR